MDNKIDLIITIPSKEKPFIEYGRHFNVQGRIIHNNSIPDDAILTVKLLDSNGKLLRQVSQNKKNNNNLYLDHPDLTLYPEEMDPGYEKLLDFGFPELLVKDLDKPSDSFNDATIKCWYSDDEFKAMIVSGTSRKQGRIFDDGISFVDEKGNAYEILEKGEYTIEVELSDNTGNLLAYISKPITIGKRESQSIVRFNPLAHRAKMIEWSRKMHFEIVDDTFPGYLEPYLGTWMYHMGLLPLYRANDIELYRDIPVHMFVYLTDPSSTSYETELAYLQSQNIIGNPDYFHAYHYDIGEAILGKDKKYERQGQILEFKDNEYLSLYRIDVVNDKAKENSFNLNEETIEDIIYDLDNISIQAGSTIAITGVVKPWQIDPKYFHLRKDNTYEINNSVNKLIYRIDDGKTTKEECRALLMERIDRKSLGYSVYEFYNLFKIDSSLKGKDLKLTVVACDLDGEKAEAIKQVKIHVE